MNTAKIIDHTNIRPKATAEDIKKTCEEAKDFRFRGVCVNPRWVKLTKKELSSSAQIKIVCLVDPPIGDSSHQKRIRVSKKAKKDGADELDVVINIPAVKHERWGEILKDLKEICRILPTKVIIGSGYLTDKEIKRASEIVKKAGAICVKTSTEKGPLGNRELKEKALHLKIMRKAAPGLLIKAAGGVRTLKDLKMMVEAGADIVGTSSGVEIETERLASLKKKCSARSAGAIIRQGKKILLLDRAFFPLGWAPPAGHINKNETPVRAIAREVKEETGLEVVKSRLILSKNNVSDKCVAGTEIHDWWIFECECRGKIKLSKKESKKFGWFTPEEIKNKVGLIYIWQRWFKKLKIIK